MGRVTLKRKRISNNRNLGHTILHNMDGDWEQKHNIEIYFLFSRKLFFLFGFFFDYRYTSSSSFYLKKRKPKFIYIHTHSHTHTMNKTTQSRMKKKKEERYSFDFSCFMRKSIGAVLCHNSCKHNKSSMPHF